MTPAESERARYARQLALPEIGPVGQQKLRAARVLVVGAGGLGSPAALYLAAAGVGTLGLVDFDRVELSNLHRQVLFATADVGESKCAAARRRLQALNPAIEVVAHDTELCAANVREILHGYDIVLDGTDRLGTRYVVNDACVLLGRPLVSAAIHRFEGQAFTYVPERGPCYRCVFPDATAGGVPNCAEAGVLGVLPAVLGAVQATEAIKLIAGIGEPLVGRLLTYDALEMRFREFAITRRADCAVCGDRPTITEPRDAGPLGTGEVPANVRRLGPAELRALLDSSAGLPRVLLIDVREPHEFHAGHLAGAWSIPLGELEQRIASIPRDGVPVFLCRSGARSLLACTIAARAGFEAAGHLEGGVLAWAAQVDGTIRIL